MSLRDEVDVRSRQVCSESYSVSVAEVINAYRDREIVIHPKMQQFFQWTDIQKAKLIESMLIGIPLTQIYVFERDDMIWEVIYGMQALTTILEFVGELRDENGRKIPPNNLVGTRYLPSLEGKLWDDLNDLDNSLTSDLRLTIRRVRLDFKILRKETNRDFKYDLFQRLHTGNAHLDYKELRNCLIVMTNERFYEWLLRLSYFEPFKNCIHISEDLEIVDQYYFDLVLKFLVFRNENCEDLRTTDSINDFISSKILEYSDSADFDVVKKAIFL